MLLYNLPFTNRHETKTNMIIQAIRHELMNLPQRPCESNPGYNFGRCAERSIMSKIGCQPPWTRFPITDFPLCNDWTQFQSFRCVRYLVVRDDVLDKNVNDGAFCYMTKGALLGGSRGARAPLLFCPPRGIHT